MSENEKTCKDCIFMKEGECYKVDFKTLKPCEQFVAAIEYGVMIGDDHVGNQHFLSSTSAYEYMNLFLAKDPRFAGVEMKVVRRGVGEWTDDTDD